MENLKKTTSAVDTEKIERASSLAIATEKIKEALEIIREARNILGDEKTNIGANCVTVQLIASFPDPEDENGRLLSSLAVGPAETIVQSITKACIFNKGLRRVLGMAVLTAEELERESALSQNEGGLEEALNQMAKNIRKQDIN